MKLDKTAEIAAQQDAIARWPEESCGVIVGSTYIPMENVAPDPKNNFMLPARALVDWHVDAIIHSHNADLHTKYPTKLDMQGQLASAMPWGLLSTDGDTASSVLMWGEFVLDEPLIGRTFDPGVHDCYALVRAWFWQVRHTRLPEYPRSDKWWERGENMIMDGAQSAGFITIPTAEIAVGDMVVMTIGSKVPNHCGMVVEDGLVLHHLTGRLSRREPLGPWMKFVNHVMRHD